jgi:hypothetical protein
MVKNLKQVIKSCESTRVPSITCSIIHWINANDNPVKYVTIVRGDCGNFL